MINVSLQRSLEKKPWIIHLELCGDHHGIVAILANDRLLRLLAEHHQGIIPRVMLDQSLLESGRHLVKRVITIRSLRDLLIAETIEKRCPLSLSFYKILSSDNIAI